MSKFHLRPADYGGLIAGLSNAAWLRNTLAQQSVNFKRQDNTTYNGGKRIRSFATDNSSPQPCENECARDPQCIDYTYVKPGAFNKGDGAVCYLHSVLGERVASSCCLSGVKDDRDKDGEEMPRPPP
jgi:hypothetical protein